MFESCNSIVKHKVKSSDYLMFLLTFSQTLWQPNSQKLGSGVRYFGILLLLNK